MDKATIAKKIILENNYFTMASVGEKRNPWITPVYYAYDISCTFYWYSQKTTKHSQLIKKNDNIAVVIFNSRYQPDEPAEDGFGVYMTGKAYEVAKEELPYALTVYFTRSFTDKKERQKMMKDTQDFLGNAPLRMYKFIPDKIYISDPAKLWKGKWLDSKSEVNL